MPNRLINEQSLYLLQHANNPVDWYPWGDEAFDKARQEGKPLIVSIGYAACHWCHVMERESFEDEETALYMNTNFVCIKVDREEHPDVDHMYMDAVQAIAGNGGWPLNVFVTPDRIPFYGGTYYPPKPAYSRPSWSQLMQRMIQIWDTQRDEVTAQAEQMVNYLRESVNSIATGKGLVLDERTTADIAENILKQADSEYGGFGNAPKFPGTMAISYLLEHARYAGSEAARGHALLSLDAMADGGIYDQLGGGFARYSTDRQWLAPHFEKMLYDNALLVISYCDAFAVTRRVRYKTIIDEVIAFVERELKDPSGGYYCALDADSEGVEGKFYTWNLAEWNSILGEDASLMAAYFGITEHGNWEETNIMHIPAGNQNFAADNNISNNELTEKIKTAKQRLLAERNKRIRPQTDDKCLLSWNALMNIALSKAARVLGNPQYAELATNHMAWMETAFLKGEEVLHTWKNGKARIPAKLDDIAYLAQAKLQLASAAGNNAQVTDAIELVGLALRDFAHEGGFFYFTSVNQTDIPVRKIDLYDGAMPSANAVMAHNLWICGMCAENTEWIEHSKIMMDKMAGTATRGGYSFSYWGQLIQRDIKGMKTLVATGKNALNHFKDINEHFLPEVYVLFSAENDEKLPLLKNKFSQDKMYIFVCTEEACFSPESTVGQAIERIDRF
ncbi:MAG: thioredoxin domain-containing protein [Taibaiella sp.]|nr:thioredoxin domain-containing protein [Taibaiella sp.]